MSVPGVPKHNLLDANPPFALQVEITSRCNLSCKMCPLTTGGTASVIHAGHISDRVWDELMHVAGQAKQVFVAGFGEPFVNPRAVQLLRQLDDAGVKTTVVTNGVAVTPRIARELTGLAHLVHINVSIDSPEPEVYRAIRGGHLAKAVQGLSNLMAAIDNPQRVSVSTVAMSENVESLLGFPPLLAKLGVRNFVLQGLVDYNDYSAERHLQSSASTRLAIGRLREDCAARGISFVDTIPERIVLETENQAELERRFTMSPTALSHDRADSAAGPDATRQCMLPWEVPYVDKDGTVFACCYAASINDRPLGQLGDRQLLDIWRAEPFRQFRRDLLSGSGMPDACRSCTAVPVGPHPLSRFTATVVHTRLRRDMLTVAVRNDGEHTWTSDDRIRLGTAGPRDGSSPLRTEAWLSENRATTFCQDQVLPGEHATFRIRLRRGPTRLIGEFELVADGVCWIPGTRIRVSVPAVTRAAAAIERPLRWLANAKDRARLGRSTAS